MHIRRLLVVVLLMLLVLPVAGLYAQDDFSPEAVAAIQAAMDDQTAGDIVGVTMRLDSPVGVFASASGYADLENEIPLQPDDAFRIGSITKMFTSTVILQLAEEGVLNIDDTLAEWLPDIAIPNNDQITLRQLMNHTSGILDYTNAPGLIESYLADPTAPLEMARIIEWLNTLDTAQFEPGADWSYSNTNYFLLGLVIEVAADSTAAEQFRSRILEPLGMEQTYLTGSEPETVAVVQGYMPDGEAWINSTTWDVNWAWTAGGLVSTPSDLVIFIRALFAGELFTQSETLDVMRTINEVIPNGYALGIGRIPPEELGFGTTTDAWGHNGGIFGYSTALYYVPDLDLVIISMINTEAANVGPPIEAGLQALHSELMNAPSE